MNQTEYTKLLDMDKPPEGKVFLTSDIFSANSADRTLLYGYDCERFTWHVYLMNDQVILHVYGAGNSVGAPCDNRKNFGEKGIAFSDLQSLIPNKRLYPEACDFEFCEWLKKNGVYLSFTVYDDKRNLSVVFHGKI